MSMPTMTASFDTGESGIGGVTITLSGTDHLGNSVLLTTTTTITGFYRFDNLYPGTYALIETQPSGYLDGTDAIGTQGGTRRQRCVLEQHCSAS
jgi:hypothetical protein